MTIKTAVPIKLCFVDTGWSLGTGIKENISNLVKILIIRGDFYYCMKLSLKEF